jgi:acetylornithine/N-succinyldiaminopimelate aminotransferase
MFAGGENFLPDGLSMAKSLGGGFPIGAFWVRAPFADLLGPGTHGTTFGGTPLACAVALKIFEVIERERLDENARKLGEWLKNELERLVKNYPTASSKMREGLASCSAWSWRKKFPLSLPAKNQRRSK